MDPTPIHHESNKENIPPICIKEESNNTSKKKNPIPPMASSFKKSRKRKTKRIPLADITHLFNNSSPLTTPHQETGVSSLPSSSVLLRSNSRRKTLTVLPAASKSLRMGFR
ncbi:uncharacterized protein LOC113855886 [Abrus precatorius]|uniref:Uncharacterized protein LOC113855886 n=1 Tax=Abrus precatorius TaxID=3816 RepID=A0A8B8KHM1_ABRPR|nr:uncharacterized protein LOC113855886 [Abrus precatorius]